MSRMVSVAVVVAALVAGSTMESALGWAPSFGAHPPGAAAQEAGDDDSPGAVGAEGPGGEGGAVPQAVVVDQSVAVGAGERFEMELALGTLDPAAVVEVEVVAIGPVSDQADLDPRAASPGLEAGPARYRADPGLDLDLEPGPDARLVIRVPIIGQRSPTPDDQSSDPEAGHGEPSADGASADGTAEREGSEGLVLVEPGLYRLDVTIRTRPGSHPTGTAGPGPGPTSAFAPDPVPTETGTDPTEARREVRLTTTIVRRPDPGTDLEPDQDKVATSPAAVVLAVTAPASAPADPGYPAGIGVEQAIVELAANPTTPMTVVIGRRVLDELGARPDQAARLVAALQGRAVVVEPRARVDPSSLAAIGQWRLYRHAVTESHDLAAGLGLVVDPAAATVPSLVTNPAAVSLLTDGITTVFRLGPPIPTPAVTATDHPLIGRRPTVAGALTEIDLVTPLSGPLTADDHQALAELLLGDRSPTSPTLIIPRSPNPEPTPDPGAGPPTPDPRRSPRVAALAATPWLTPVSLTDPSAPAPTTTEPAPGQPLPPHPAPDTDLSPLIEPLARAEARLATYATTYVDGPRPPARLLLDLSHATGTHLTPRERVAAVEAVATEADQALAVVSVADNQAVTLAARTAEIPVAVENQAGGARRVRLELRSDHLITADHLDVVLEPGPNVVGVEVETRSLGVSPLSVTVVTPDGRQELATTRFRVRSTAIPGLGIALSIGGLILLGLWWFLHARSRPGGEPEAATVAIHHQRVGDGAPPTG